MAEAYLIATLLFNARPGKSDDFVLFERNRLVWITVSFEKLLHLDIRGFTIDDMVRGDGEIRLEIFQCFHTAVHGFNLGTFNIHFNEIEFGDVVALDPVVYGDGLFLHQFFALGFPDRRLANCSRFVKIDHGIFVPQE